MSRPLIKAHRAFLKCLAREREKMSPALAYAAEYFALSLNYLICNLQKPHADIVALVKDSLAKLETILSASRTAKEAP